MRAQRISHYLLLLGLVLLLAACATAGPTVTPPPSATPLPFVPTQFATDLPTLTPLPSLTADATAAGVATQAAVTQAAVTQAAVTQIAANMTSTPTVTLGTVEPSSTSALLGMPSPTPAVTALPSPAVLPGREPPLTLTLPTGWTHAYKIVPIQDNFGGSITEQGMNVAIYSGPVGSAKGTILVLWGFPSLGPAPVGLGSGDPLANGLGTLTPKQQQDMTYTDGVRLLRGTVVDISCNVGEYGEQGFSVGNQDAVGEYFAAAQCQGETDIYGWWVGVHQFNTNILFYAYVEPPSAINDSKKPLQAILDTVVFRPPANVATPATTAVPTTTPALH